MQKFVSCLFPKEEKNSGRKGVGEESEGLLQIRFLKERRVLLQLAPENPRCGEENKKKCPHRRGKEKCVQWCLFLPPPYPNGGGGGSGNRGEEGGMISTFRRGGAGSAAKKTGRMLDEFKSDKNP